MTYFEATCSPACQEDHEIFDLVSAVEASEGCIIAPAEKKALITIFRKGHYFLFMARSVTVCLCGRDWPRISQKEHAPPVRLSLSLILLHILKSSTP